MTGFTASSVIGFVVARLGLSWLSGNAGEIPFDSARRGYGALVLAEQAYRLTSSWDSEMIIEFSDPVLGQYFESESSIILDAAGGILCCCTHASKKIR